jgi:hypothetical protein
VDPEAQILTFTVLAHWSFTSEPEGDFRYLMQHLDLGMLGTAPPPAPLPAPGAPPAAPDPRPALTVLDTGHLAIKGVSRAGAATTSWYRGPFTPVAILRPAPTDPAGVMAWASDQLRRVGPDGREEVSLAVAYELGRTMAAAQPGVIAALLAWRAAGYSLSRVTALLASGGSAVHEQLAAVLAQESPDFSGAVTAELLAGIGAAALGPVRPASSPPSVLPTGQSLSQTIAQGFGLDPTTVSDLLSSPSVATTVGLPGTATVPLVPQPLADLTATSFGAASTRTVAVATWAVRQVVASAAVLEPPVLTAPVGLFATRLATAERQAVTELSTLGETEDAPTSLAAPPLPEEAP